jgi:hypothetical protein
MKSINLVLMGIAVVTVGIFALPTTMSLFAGQHTWYDLGPAGNQVPCKKCHADVYEEYAMSGVHGTLSGGTSNVTGDDPDRACGACHRVNLTGYTFASGDGTGSTEGKEAHAAAVIACMECHEFGQPYYSVAGGFNVSYWVDNNIITTSFNYTDDTHNGTYAAHNAFVAMAINDTTLQDSNEACIACHTNIAVKINWTHARSLEFNVGIGDPMKTDVGVHNWTMTNWAVNGTANAIVWGNTTGAGNTTYNSTYWPGNVNGIYS